MSEKRADLVGRFRRKNVLELACLLLNLAFTVHGETVGEQAFRESMAPNNATRPLAAARREFDNHVPSPIEADTGLNASWQGFTNGL